jgi:arylsulfatase A-like enzyme
MPTRESRLRAQLARLAAARWGPASLAVAVAALTEFLFDVGFSLARGTVLDPGYAGLCGLLTLAAGLACVAAGAVLPRSGVRIALTLYVAMHGFANALGTPEQTGGALAMALITWAFLARSRTPAARAGLMVGSGLCIALVLPTYLQGLLALPAPWGSDWLLGALLFMLVLGATRAWDSLQARGLALPPLAGVLIATLGPCLTSAVVAVQIKRVQTMTLGDEPRQASAPGLPSVIVLVLDTVRADHLSSYGYARETTPNLTRFLRDHPEARQYEFAFSPASWTIPSHSSLLTGVMPSAHGARASDRQSIADSATRTIALHAEQTLAELLRGDGYCNVGVVANAYLLRVEGLQRGFDVFVQPHPTRPLQLLGGTLRKTLLPEAYAGRIKPYPLADRVNEQVLEMIEKCGQRPVFVLANYMDAHSPYLAPPPHAGLFAGDHPTRALQNAVLSDADDVIALKRDRYDESLHSLDSELARFFEALEATQAMDNSWLFITADHGEAFLEHGTTAHGSSIYNEQVRIPLIVKPPRAQRLPAAGGPASLIDITTTIAALAGHPRFGVGSDLRLPQRSSPPIGIEFSGRFRRNVEEFGETSDDPARAVISGRFKLLERGGSYELYDLSADPHELVDRGNEDARLVHSLAAALPTNQDASFEPREAMPPHAPLGPDEAEDLRELGYAR